MAINFLELVPNKNYGFQLTAPDLSVDLLTLNLVDGTCTSTYFNDPEITQFQRAALELFAVVAPPERAPGALNMLNRLLAVVPVDDAALTLSAVVVGNLATLRATINANPGSILAHVPYSSDGALAWAGGNASGGGGGAVNAVSATFPITSTGGVAPDIGVVLNTAKGVTSAPVTGVEVKLDAVTMVFDGGGNVSLANTLVVPGTYGDSVNVPQLSVDSTGRLTNVVNVPISIPPAGVTAVTASSPLASSGGATPNISLNAGGLSGDVLTWNGAAWVASPLPAGVTVSLLNDVFVAQNGNDLTGDGSASAPFATVTAAMASITTAAPNNRFAIRVSAGDYAEPGAISLKPDVFIIGDGWENTSINTTGVVLSGTWVPGDSSFSGFYDVAINGPTTINFVPSGSVTGRFNAVNTRFEDDLTITAFSDSNIFGIVRCVTGAGVIATYNGGDIFSFGTLYQGPINIGESATAAKTFFTSMNDTFNGTLTATNAGGTPAGDFIVVVLGSSLGYEVGNPNARENAIFNGQVILRATSNFVPDSANITLSGGATLEQWSFATGVGYEPAVPGNWLVAPTEVSGALDELAARAATAGTVTAVTATGPLASSGGTTPDISLNASGVVAGSYGSATSVPVFNVTTEGLISSVTDTAITFPVTAVTATGPLASSGGATPDISLTGIVPMANGGTNASAFNANGVVVVNGAADTLIDVVGASSGDVLTWNGSAWISAAVPGGVATVTASSPLASSGGANPDISLNAGTNPNDVLTWNGAAWVSAAPTGGLVNWTENTTTYSGRVINDFTTLNAATDVDAALVAKGNGATVAQIADGTAAGGNNRGQYATDWQKARGAATQVASGNYSTIVGGWLNTASGDFAVLGGVNNTGTGDGNVVLGRQNQVTTPYAAAVGYNNTVNNQGVIAMGYQTQATANGAVAYGLSVTASGQNATAVSGGGGVASGNGSSVLGGFGNAASGVGSVAVGGQNNTASGYWAGALSGYGNVAASAYEAALGYYAYDFGGTSNTFVPTDVALGYGNGTGTGASASNAFTFLKNGWLALGRGQVKPQDALDVNGSARMTGAVVQDGFTSGAAITAGQVCYLAADGFVYPAQSNSTTTSTVVGIAVETVGAGGLEIALATFNKTGGFAGLTTGTEYFLSATAAGAVVTYATLSATSGAQIVSLGYARSATEIQLNIQRRGVTP